MLTSVCLNSCLLNISILRTTVTLTLVVQTLMGLIIAPVIPDTLAMESRVLVGIWRSFTSSRYELSV